jgi:HEPN domain-containing protein
MAERSADWMEQARRDLDSARWMVQGGFHEWACFAAQQAAEKGVKAVYARLSGAAWGHSVAELLTGLAERVEVPVEVRDAGRRLDRFYVPARYPNGWEAGTPQRYFTEEDAEGAIGDSDAVLRFCEGLLAR